MATNPGYSKEKLFEIISFYLEYGEEDTLNTFNIASETLNRTKRKFNAMSKDDQGKLNLSGTLNKIRENYSDKELKAIAGGGRIIPGQDKVPIIDFSGKKYKFGYFTDPHMGSIYFKENMYFKMLEKFRKEKVESIMCTGDLTEGMSNRAGHIYELTHLGFHNQKEYAVKMLSKIKTPLYIIDGNHDRWHIKNGGALMVKDVCEKLNFLYPKRKYEFVGHDTGFVNINGCNIQLWHGEDGNSYATSYRMQKIVESITGGNKPNVLLCGHTHKQGYFFERHIHVVSGGCIQMQSAWMRGKRIAAHTGFWIIEMTINNDGNVASFTDTWYPFYQ